MCYSPLWWPHAFPKRRRAFPETLTQSLSVTTYKCVINLLYNHSLWPLINQVEIVLELTHQVLSCFWMHSLIDTVANLRLSFYHYLILRNPSCTLSFFSSPFSLTWNLFLELTSIFRYYLNQSFDVFGLPGYFSQSFLLPRFFQTNY